MLSYHDLVLCIVSDELEDGFPSDDNRGRKSRKLEDVFEASRRVRDCVRILGDL